MRKTLLSFAATISLLALAGGPALASDKSDVVAAVKKFDDAFNKGDAKGIVAACTPQALIIDDFPPHAWQGADTCANWARALDAYDKQSGIVAGPVTIGKP